MGSSNDLQPRRLNRFLRVIPQKRGSVQGCAFSGLEDKNLTFTPVIPEKLPFLGPILTGLKIFDRKPLYYGVLPCKLPLVVVVAPLKLYSEQATWGR